MQSFRDGVFLVLDNALKNTLFGSLLVGLDDVVDYYYYYYYYYCYCCCYYYYYYYYYCYQYYFCFILNEKRNFLNHIYKNRLFTPQLIEKLKPFPRQSSPTPRKHQKQQKQKFSEVFKGKRKGALGINGLKTLNAQY